MDQEPHAQQEAESADHSVGKGGDTSRSQRGLLRRIDGLTAACAVAMLAVCVGFLRREPFGNELVYLIGPTKLASPGLLSNDWAWGRSLQSTWVFDALLSPLAWALPTTWLAIFGRLIVWTVALRALALLARSLDLNAPGFLLGFLVWLAAGQSLYAGEWLFGGIESKCVSYALVILALRFVLVDRLNLAAACIGAATSVHVLVGGWSAICLGMAVVARELIDLGPSKAGARRVGVFVGLATLTAAPGLVSSLALLFEGGSLTREHLEIIVFLRNPHHLDPASFLWSPRRAAVTLVLSTALTTILLWRGLDRRRAVPLIAFLATAVLIFAAGVAARALSVLGFLNLYPFRVGSLFLLLLACLAAPGWLRATYLRREEGRRRSIELAAVGMLATLVVLTFPRHQVVDQTHQVLATAESLARCGPPDPFDDTAEWIRTRSPRESVFVAPPWENRFWLAARRAQVVSIKHAPPSSRIGEWFVRLHALVGDPWTNTRGALVLPAGKEHYASLTRGDLTRIRDDYGATHYLAVRPRPDLGLPLLLEREPYFVYDLAPLR